MVTEREKEKELVELFEVAKKAAGATELEEKGGAEESRCLDALAQLKAFPVTAQLLVSTQVGKLLRPLTKHSRKNIQDLASDVFPLWKKKFLEQTSSTKKNGMLEDKTSVKSTENIKIEKTRTIKVEAKTEHKGEPRSAKVVESECLLRSPRMKSIPKCNDPSRDNIREQLYEALCKVSSEANEEIQKEVNACDAIGVAVAVESALFSNWGPSNGSDRIKYRSLIFNTRDAKNPDFRRKVLLGQVKPERIAELSSEEMASDERRKKNKEIKEKALLVCQLAGAPKATTDQFKCGRCGQRKTSYYQMQTRSADEPMTTYVTCVNCSNRWKMH